MDQKMEKNKNKTGLVLEGGGMRGIYTAGVLDVFSFRDRREEASGIIKNTVRTSAL